MTRKYLTATVALLAGLLSSTALSAQDLKLYAFSSGALTLGKGYLVNALNVDNDEQQLPVHRKQGLWPGRTTGQGPACRGY